MKTYRNLYSQVISLENIMTASSKAARGKRYKPAVASYLFNEPANILHIQRLLRKEYYHFGPYRLKIIHDPKKRLIAAAPVSDRVVHHAVMNILEPIFLPRFIAGNYASIKHRGVHRAVIAFQDFYRRFPWMIKLDVSRYFPSISWDTLMGIIRRTVKDRALLLLISRLLESGAGLYDDSRIPFSMKLNAKQQPIPRRSGLPIGNLTSQFFGLLYLNELDHYAKRVLKIPGYLRYVDDMAIFGKNRAEMRTWSRQIREWLERERKLILNPIPRMVHCPSQKSVFLGYEISRTTRRARCTAERRLRKVIEKRIADPPGGSQTADWERSLISRLGFALF